MECAQFESGEELLAAWLAWYVALDEAALPLAEAERQATKKGLSVEDAFAGLLIFDLLCLSTVRQVFPTAPFSEMAAFAGRLPFASYAGKHDAAARFFSQQDVDIAFAQLTDSIDGRSGEGGGKG